MKKLFLLSFFFFSEIILAQSNPQLDSIVVKTSNDTVYVWDYNAWEQCGFQLDYSVEISDSIITISQIDTAADMTTCYGYHNFVTPVVGLSEGKFRIDIYRDCLFQENRFIKSFRFEYVISDIRETKEQPNHFVLYDAYPNPFGKDIHSDNPSTTIKYSIPSVMVQLRQMTDQHDNVTLSLSKDDIQVTLKIFDILGREVATLINEKQSPGNYEVKFDASNLPSGIYFYKLQAGNFDSTKKLILIK